MDANIIDWTKEEGRWSGEFAGDDHASGISVIFNHMDEAGLGPALHRHPYAETFVIRQGCVQFTVAGETIVAHAGQIVVVGPGIAHAFVGLGEPPIEMLDIHASNRFVTEWL